MIITLVCNSLDTKARLFDECCDIIWEIDRNWMQSYLRNNVFPRNDRNIPEYEHQVILLPIINIAISVDLFI